METVMQKRLFIRMIILVLSLAVVFNTGCASAQDPLENIDQEDIPSQEQEEIVAEEPTEALPLEVDGSLRPNDPNFPPAMIYHSGLYESSDQRILIFGGNSKHGINGDIKEVFSYDPGSGSWAEPVPFEANPPWKNALAPAYDQESDRVIILNMEGETWTYDLGSNTWENMQPATSPSGRCGQTLVYDSESDAIILFGGYACTSPMDPPSAEVWVYDFNTNTWTAMGAGPHERIFHTAVYDSESDRMLMWGGRSHEEASDTSMWAYDYNTDSWIEYPAEGGPEFRSTYHTMTYIPELDRTIIIGGVVLTAALAGDFVPDIWEYDFNNNNWEMIETSGDPPALAKQVMVYDPQTGLMYMYGGSRDIMYNNAYISFEFWSYDPINHQWNNLLVD
jgi:hypothetical protein